MLNSLLQEDPATFINQQTTYKIGQSTKEQLQGSCQVEIHIFFKIFL